MSDLGDWVREVCALPQASDGVQRSIMPAVWSGEEWSFAPKGGTTPNITLFTDRPDQ